MKRILSIVLAMLCMLPVMATADRTDEEGYEYGIVRNDGLLVKSLEHYASEWIEMPPCDRIFQEDNWYCYQYRDRGLQWSRHGGKDPEAWGFAERYADALCSTGYYEPLRSDIQDDEVFFVLAYVGPGRVSETFSIRRSDPSGAAIVVASYMGDINIYYSRDIMTSDLNETQERLGTDIYISGGGTDDPWEHDCITCGFDGTCNTCGGTGQVYRSVPGTNDYVWQTCTANNCQNGRCRECGGDGMK